MINGYSIQKLEEYIDKQIHLSEAKLDPKQLAEPTKTLWNKYARISSDVPAIGLIYIAGFDGILEGKLEKDSPVLISWVRNVSRTRSANFIGAMSALFLTASLEDFADALAELWAENSADFESECRSLGLAKTDDLKKIIAPTAKSGQWFKQLHKYLGYKADAELVAIIEDMLEHRTTAAHEDVGGFDDIIGEQLKMD